jgi:hypothetical protein
MGSASRRTKLDCHNLDIIDSKVSLLRRIHLNKKRSHVATGRERGLNRGPNGRSVRSDRDARMDGIGKPELATVPSDLSRELVSGPFSQTRFLPDIGVNMVTLGAVLSIACDPHVALSSAWSAIARHVLVTVDDCLPHRAVRSEVPEKPRLEASRFEAAIRDEGVPR